MLEQKLPVTPLSEAELSLWEAEANAPFPPDFRSYLGLCNFFIQFESHFSTLSGKEAHQIWKKLNEDLKMGKFAGLADLNEIEFNNYGIQEKKIRNTWWHPKWIPFARDTHGNLKCVDLDPQRQGVKGQILEMNFKDGIGPYITDFESFSDYLEFQLDCLIDHRYQVINGEVSIEEGI